MSLSFGGLGITVCPGWHNPAVFIAWIEENIGPRPEQQHPRRMPFSTRSTG